MLRLKDHVYRLLSKRHIERWKLLTEMLVSSTKIRILMFLNTHPNSTKDELIEHLLFAKHFESRATCVRKVNLHLTDLEKKDYIEIKNDKIRLQRNFKFIFWEKTISDSWLLVVFTLGISFTLIAYVESGFSFFTLSILFMTISIGLHILDLAFHQTPY